MSIEPGGTLEGFLKIKGWDESAIREIMTSYVFMTFSLSFLKEILKHRKISIDFIRELGSNVKIDWNLFMNDKHEYYTEEEKNKLIKEFNLFYEESVGKDFNK